MNIFYFCPAEKKRPPYSFADKTVTPLTPCPPYLLVPPYTLLMVPKSEPLKEESRNTAEMVGAIWYNLPCVCLEM
jgi:hypothetical protein